MSELNTLSDASAAALESLTANAAPDPATPVVPDTPTAAVADGKTPGAPATPPEANIPEFKGTRHKVKVRGTEEEVDYDELVKGYSRTADYTRSKQELAEQVRVARELQAQVEAERDRVKSMFGDDPLLTAAQRVAEHYKVPFNQALQAVLEHQQKQTPNATPQTPPAGADQIATVDAARQIAERQLQNLQQQMLDLQRQMQGWTQEQIAAAKNEIVTSQQSNEYAQEISTFLSDVFTKNPILNAVDNMEDILRFKVYQADPATVNEAKDLFAKFAQEQVEKLTSHFTELNKDKVAQKAKLTTQGIEPPGGSGVVPQPVNHKFGSTELRNAAEDYLKSILS
jgi:hypothetical protein